MNVFAALFRHIGHGSQEIGETPIDPNPLADPSCDLEPWQEVSGPGRLIDLSRGLVEIVTDPDLDLMLSRAIDAKEITELDGVALQMYRNALIQFPPDRFQVEERRFINDSGRHSGPASELIQLWGIDETPIGEKGLRFIDEMKAASPIQQRYLSIIIPRTEQDAAPWKDGLDFTTAILNDRGLTLSQQYRHTDNPQAHQILPIPSPAMLQALLNARSGEHAVQLVFDTGTLADSDNYFARLGRGQQTLLVNADTNPVVDADRRYYGEYLITMHDFVHAWIASRVPKDHREFLVGVANLIENERDLIATGKAPKTPEFAAVYNGDSAKFISEATWAIEYISTMDFACYRPLRDEQVSEQRFGFLEYVPHYRELFKAAINASKRISPPPWLADTLK